MKHSSLFLAILLCSGLGLPTSAEATDLRWTGPSQVWTVEALETAAPHRLYLKLAEGTDAVQINTTTFGSPVQDPRPKPLR